MSETKGQLVWLHGGSLDHLQGMRSAVAFPERHSTGMESAYLTPIEDESLPHPGDGKEWKTLWNDLVDIVTAPWMTEDGIWMVAARDVGLSWHAIYQVGDLRERQPEPEHKPWCDHYVAMSYAGCTDVCTCERRSGELPPFAQLPDGTDLYRRSGSIMTLHPDERSS